MQHACHGADAGDRAHNRQADETPQGQHVRPCASARRHTAQSGGACQSFISAGYHIPLRRAVRAPRAKRARSPPQRPAARSLRPRRTALPARLPGTGWRIRTGRRIAASAPTAGLPGRSAPAAGTAAAAALGLATHAPMKSRESEVPDCLAPRWRRSTSPGRAPRGQRSVHSPQLWHSHNGGSATSRSFSPHCASIICLRGNGASSGESSQADRAGGALIALLEVAAAGGHMLRMNACRVESRAAPGHTQNPLYGFGPISRIRSTKLVEERRQLVPLVDGELRQLQPLAARVAAAGASPSRFPGGGCASSLPLMKWHW